MESLNLRLPLPPKESEWERKERYKKERTQLNAYRKFRMDVISETYSMHLKDLFLTKAFERFLDQCGKELEKIKYRKSKVDVRGDHILKVDQYGKVTMSPNLKSETPSKFYLTSKHASWKVYRHHHAKYGHQPTPNIYRTVSFLRPIKKEEDLYPYSEYVKMISEMMKKTAASEGQVKGVSKKGSFMMLSEIEEKQFDRDLRKRLLKEKPINPFRIRKMDVASVKHTTERLAERKLKEREAKVGKVSFKGQGTKKGQGSSKASSRRVSETRDQTITELEAETIPDSDAETIPESEEEAIPASEEAEIIPESEEEESRPQSEAETVYSEATSTAPSEFHSATSTSPAPLVSETENESE